MSEDSPRKSAICYCRTSTTGQKEAETITAQIQRCKAMVERRGLDLLPYGPTKDGWLIDDGVSGSLLDGRSFASFLDDLEARKVSPDFLVVYSLSRIARIDRTSKEIDRLKASAIASARIQAVLIGTNVHVLDEDGPMDPSSLTFNLKLMLAAEEYKLIRARTMSGKARRLGEGKYARGGHPPYGYQQVGDRKDGYRLEPHPTEADSFRLIIDWYLEGGVTYAARKATEAEIPTPMDTTTKRKNQAKDWTPTRWDPVSVQHITRNIRSYLGETEYVFDGQPYVIKYPPLIDFELFTRVEIRRKERTLKKRTTFLTTGFVDCICGEHLVQKATHDHHLSQCLSRCGSMRQEILESLLWIATVCRLVQIRQHEGASSNLQSFDEEISKVKREIEAINHSINTLLDLHLGGGLDRAVWKTRNDGLNQKKAIAQAELDKVQRMKTNHVQQVATEKTLEAELKGIMESLLTNGADPPLEVKREVLGKLLSGGRVVVQFDAPKVVKRKDGGISRKAQLCQAATLVFPEFGSLPKLRLDTSKDIWTQVLGPTSIGGKHTFSNYLGQSIEDIEAQLLAQLKTFNVRVVSRKVRPDGVVVLKKVADIPD